MLGHVRACHHCPTPSAETSGLCRFLLTIFIGIFFGFVMWALGGRVTTQNGIFTSAGALYASTVFIGIINSISVQPIISQQRGVMYREKAAGTYAIWPWYCGIVRPMPYVLACCGCSYIKHSPVHGHVAGEGLRSAKLGECDASGPGTQHSQACAEALVPCWCSLRGSLARSDGCSDAVVLHSSAAMVPGHCCHAKKAVKPSPRRSGVGGLTLCCSQPCCVSSELRACRPEAKLMSGVQVTLELLYGSIQTIIFSCVLYFASGFARRADKFWWFTLFLWWVPWHLACMEHLCAQFTLVLAPRYMLADHSKQQEPVSLSVGFAAGRDCACDLWLITGSFITNWHQNTGGTALDILRGCHVASLALSSPA